MIGHRAVPTVEKFNHKYPVGTRVCVVHIDETEIPGPLKYIQEIGVVKAHIDDGSWHYEVMLDNFPDIGSIAFYEDELASTIRFKVITPGG